MDRVAVEYPDRCLGIAAHLIPKEVTATIEAGSGALDPADFAILRAIREAIPHANDCSPTQIFEHVLSALRQADAKVTRCTGAMSNCQLSSFPASTDPFCPITCAAWAKLASC